MTTGVVLVLAGGLVLLAAAVLIGWGWRGRRVDDHPLCRRCGFDLTGKPDTSVVCGECGADLARPRALRVGHRRRRWALLATGLALLALLLAGGGKAGVAAWRRTNLQNYKPAWWLYYDTESYDGVVRSAAFAELRRRAVYAQGTPQDRVDAIARHALAVQADASRPWNPAWLDLVESAMYYGRLSPAVEAEFGRQMLPTVRVVVRGRVKAASTIPVRFDFVPTARVGPTTKNFLSCDLEHVEQMIDGKVPDTEPLLRWRNDPMARDRVDKWLYLPHAGRGRPAITPGSHILRVRFVLKVNGYHKGQPAVLAERAEDVSLPFTVAPQGEATISVRHDPTAGVALQKAFTSVRAYRTSINGTPEFGTVELGVGSTPLPVGVAFKASLRSNGQEWPGGDFALPAGATARVAGASIPKFTLPPSLTAADIVLRFDPDAAERTTDTFDVWDGELVFPNVPIDTLSLANGKASVRRATTKAAGSVP